MPKEEEAPPVRERKTVSIDRLRRSSTMQDHIQVTTLKVPTMYGKQVEMIRLRTSFDGFTDGGQGASDKPTAEGEGKEKVAKASGGGHDILLTIQNAELVDLQPMESSWCASILIDNKAIRAIDKFIEAGLQHFKERHMHTGLVSPFAEAAATEQPFAHLQVKISEFQGKIMHTTFLDPKGEKLCKPGDSMMSLKVGELVGPCSVTIHLAGYWYDASKQGPLLYLTNVSKIDPTMRAPELDMLEAPPSPSMHQMTQSPGGSVRRGLRLSMKGVASAEDVEICDSVDVPRVVSYRFSGVDDSSDSSISEGELNKLSPNSQRLAEIKKEEERSLSPPMKQASYVRRKLQMTGSSPSKASLPPSLLSETTTKL